MSQTDYHPLYIKGIELFNERGFYEAHDIWEELWTDYQGDSRKFYQGLIQVAVSLYHFGNKNIRGARKLYLSSRNYLEPYRPLHHGIDLEKLFTEFEKCYAEMFSSDEEYPQVVIDESLIPTIDFHEDRSYG